MEDRRRALELATIALEDEHLAAELVEACWRVAERLARARPFKAAAAALAEVLLERGHVNGEEAELILENASTLDEEGGGMDENDALRRERDIRKLVMLEIGAAEPPADLDEELRLVELHERLTRWREDWWRLLPASEVHDIDDLDDGLPDRFEVEVTRRDGERKAFQLERATVDRVLERGHHTLVEHRDDTGTRFELRPSRSTTRAYDGRGKIIEER